MFSYPISEDFQEFLKKDLIELEALKASKVAKDDVTITPKTSTSETTPSSKPVEDFSVDPNQHKQVSST